MSLTLIIIIVLVLGVIFVNGWTDAPNAIATVVSTRAMTAKSAVLMAAVFNFFGVLVMTFVNAKVATTIANMVDFGTGHDSQVALASALFAIVVWAVAAWFFGIPTSESHALIAGVTGAGIAISGFGSVNGGEWLKVIYGLGISSVIGVASGYFVVKLIELLCKNVKRKTAYKAFTGGQILSGAANAFLHGAQDGQKFMAVFLVGLYLAKGQAIPGTLEIPIEVMLLCSVVMGVGTSIGGYRIIKAVGMDMVKLERYQGFAADVAAAGCLLFSSLAGIPISTTHTKTTAIMGVGSAKRLSNVNWNIVKDMVLAWILTFPGCIIIGYLMSKLFMFIF